MDARRLLAAACLSITWISIAACSPIPEPKQLPPQTVTPTPDPPPPSDPPPPAPERPSTVVVVDHGGAEDVPPQTLAEAARAEKERRQAVGKPAVKITDKNLAEYAAKGQITTGKPTPPPAPASADAKAATDKKAQDEEYWRQRGLEIRQRWHDAVEEGKKQQSAVERLRTQFYSEDDPYVRDGRIKPSGTARSTSSTRRGARPRPPSATWTRSPTTAIGPALSRPGSKRESTSSRPTRRRRRTSRTSRRAPHPQDSAREPSTPPPPA
jgi:hypothetical protein